MAHDYKIRVNLSREVTNLRGRLTSYGIIALSEHQPRDFVCDRQ